MISLVMDTSNSYLAVGLYQDNVCLEAFQEKGSRRQSEKAIPTLKEVLDRHHIALKDVNEMIAASGALTSTIAITSVYYFIAARIVLAVGESGNFPAAIKVTAEYFPKKTVPLQHLSLMPDLHRCPHSPSEYSSTCQLFQKYRCGQRMGNGFHRNWCAGIYLDGTLDVHV